MSKKVKSLGSIGDPQTGATIAPGATVELPEDAADKLIAEGKAVEAEEEEKDGVHTENKEDQAAG
jgi:hypothetical protein